MPKLPLVLLHGWGVNSKIWDPLLPGFKKSFEVRTIDLPGFGGDVDYDGEFNLDVIVDRVVHQSSPTDVFCQPAVSQPAIWVAWSMGATIAIAAALKYPDRFLQLNLVSPTPKFKNDETWKLGMDKQTIQNLSDQFQIDYDKGLKKFLLLQVAGSTDSRMIAKEQKKRLSTLQRPSESALLNSLELLETTDLRDQICADSVLGQMPIQIIAGTHDRIVPYGASKWIADQLPNAKLIEMNCGHLSFIQKPERFIDMVKSFVGANA